MSKPAAPASEFLSRLDRRDRRDVDAIAESANVAPELIAAEIVAAYLRLMRDVPGALPRNPLAPIRSGAQRRAGQ